MLEEEFLLYIFIIFLCFYFCFYFIFDIISRNYSGGYSIMKDLTEREILACFDEAIFSEHICAYYQPKFNHSTGRIIGAEALMRWVHPEYGMQSPVNFIPVLEKHNLIYRADLFLFECICKFLHLCPVKFRIPISFNVSRYDLFQKNYIDDLETIRDKYKIPVEYLQAEITESSAIGGLQLIKDAIQKFHDLGYLVAMDDFGSGYSSLSILKSLPVDILKLDLRFLMDEGIDGRGGIILNSTIQMAKWLETVVIAEGVETIEQADFLKSIGCNYIQGYLYSKPVSENDFRELLERINYEPTFTFTTFVEGLKVKQFWNPNSLETLIFNTFVGSAAIFTFRNEKIDLIRVNEKYVKEFGIGLSEKDVLNTNPFDVLDEDNRRIYLAAIKRAIRTNEEVSCETWRNIKSGCCGIERMCIRSDLRVIAKSEHSIIIYAIIHNVTREKEYLKEILDSERKFRFASEQANMYAWEYIVDTREMHPCFRCMRDLGLPPVVRNYPEPAIEAGIFPPDYADMYRDWHKQIANGAKQLEAIIPLTAGRIPFVVRYTTEFDENGKPLKAYGSATLVQDKKVIEEMAKPKKQRKHK